MHVALITPAHLQTNQQIDAFAEQQYYLNHIEYPSDVVVQQFITGNTNLTTHNYPLASQVLRRRFLIKVALDWLNTVDDEIKIIQWLDADDCPSAYWVQGLRQCNHALNILAVSQRTIITFTTQYMFAGRRAFEQLAKGACGVGAGSAIAWRVDLIKDAGLLQHLKMEPKYYDRFCGIEDVVLGVEVARNYPDHIGYVTSGCCQDDCGQGLPVVYIKPSHTLGVDCRVERNQLLAKYRAARDTEIQGCDISGGYGSTVS
jgi:hypothetical protein